MIDTNFHKKLRSGYKLSDLAKQINAISDPPISDASDVIIKDIVLMDIAEKGDLTVLNNQKYAKLLKITKASACIVPETTPSISNGLVLLKVKNPYLAHSKLVDMFYTSAKHYGSKILPSAYIAKSARIGANCYIGHNVVIEDNVIIGDDSIIESGTFIDYGVKIGKRAKIYSNVSISYSIIGDDVIILPGAKIGQDGFGFATDNGVHHKIYHVGRVIIGNNVEIGANTTIDRGSMKDTIIDDWCRIDNLVQIGHNAQIGRGSIIVAQVGIAGSTNIGKYCALGGQVGVAGHLTIADKVQVAAQGGVIQDISEEAVIMGGTPTVPLKDWHRQSLILKQLTKKKLSYK